MNWKTTLSSFGLSPQYLSLGTSVTELPFCHFSIFHGPPEKE